MSSLWTPEGEHRVPRPGDPDPSAGPARPGPDAGSPQPSAPPPPGGPRGGPGPEPGEPTDEELREMARRLAEAPVEDVVANHCYGLFELAALHLSQRPAHLPQARLAIDAMAFVVEGLGERLGEHEAALREGVSQARLAYVRISEASSAANGSPTEPAGDS